MYHAKRAFLLAWHSDAAQTLQKQVRAGVLGTGQSPQPLFEADKHPTLGTREHQQLHISHLILRPDPRPL
jgi:hypothetical protein